MADEQKVEAYRDYLKRQIRSHQSGAMMSIAEASWGETNFSEALREFEAIFGIAEGSSSGEGTGDV